MDLPKYSKLEIERRFLVVANKLPALDTLPFSLIDDRYIDGTRLRLRSITDHQTGARNLKLCKKYETDEESAGPIVNVYLTEAEFDILSQLPGHILSKRRYHLDHVDRRWVIDVFPDGLLLCEIELDDRSEAIKLPLWVGREVTLDPSFAGANLALQRIASDRLPD